MGGSQSRVKPYRVNQPTTGWNQETQANGKENQGTQSNGKKNQGTHTNGKKNRGTQADFRNEEGFAGPNMRADVHFKIAEFLEKETCFKWCYISFKGFNIGNAKGHNKRLIKLNRCKVVIDGCDKSIGVIDLAIQLEQGGYHANMVIIYKDTKRVLHLEPHGPSKYNILELLRATWPDYQVTNPTATCRVQGGLPWCRIYADLYALILVGNPQLANNPEQIREEVRDITSNVEVLETFMRLVKEDNVPGFRPNKYQRIVPRLSSLPQKHMAAIEYYTQKTKKGLSLREMENINTYSETVRPVMMPPNVEPTDKVYENMEALYNEWKKFMQDQELTLSLPELTPEMSRAKKYNMQVRSMLNMERKAMSVGSEPFTWEVRKLRAVRHLKAMKLKEANKATSNLHKQLGGRNAKKGVITSTSNSG